ncbi:MAG: Na+/H+ antiporter [Frankiaceae bacterium]
MVEGVAFALAALALIAVATLVSDRSGLPPPVLLVLAGLVYAVLPGPNVSLDPDLVLFVLLPPLLFAAALDASLLEIRAALRPIVSLSVLLVLVTALAVGVVVDAVVPGLPFAAGVALGAAVAPPDPVAALAIARRAGIPQRLTTLIEGEGLLNDATALTTFEVAIAAVIGGGFSVGDAAGRFLLAAVGGAAIGLGVAWLVQLPRHRLHDPLVVNALSLATPYLVFLPAQEAHTSGVLAVVLAGLWLGHRSPELLTGETRLQTRAVWRLVNFLLEGFVFLLIGQQLPVVARGLKGYPVPTIVAAVGGTVGVVLLLRPLWLTVMSRLRGGITVRSGELSTRELVALSWAGTRGVITLAAAFAIPLTAQGRPFPARDLLLLCAYVVVLVTLLGQGLTLAPLLRRLHLGGGPAEEGTVMALARAAALDAALRQLDELAADSELPDEVLNRLRHDVEQRRSRLKRFAAAPPQDRETAAAALTRARRTMIDAQREELLRWRDAGRLSDHSMRALERELDHAEGLLGG